MSEQQARDAIKEVLHPIAPEANLDQVPPDADLRQELAIDSMDILNFAIEPPEGPVVNFQRRARTLR